MTGDAGVVQGGGDEVDALASAAEDDLRGRVVRGDLDTQALSLGHALDLVPNLVVGPPGVDEDGGHLGSDVARRVGGRERLQIRGVEQARGEQTVQSGQTDAVGEGESAAGDGSRVLARRVAGEDRGHRRHGRAKLGLEHAQEGHRRDQDRRLGIGRARELVLRPAEDDLAQLIRRSLLDPARP